MATICLIKSVSQFAPKNPAQSGKKTWEPDNDDDNGRINIQNEISVGALFFVRLSWWKHVA
jgi:hypothetical protein